MIVVTDTSVVLNLCSLHYESLLSVIYEQVFAPLQVRTEFERLAFADSRFIGLPFPEFVKLIQPRAIPDSLRLNPALDEGEIAAISLALELGVADVLIDEKAARSAAIALGLRVSGLLGILIEGKNRNLIPTLAPLLDQLSNHARFWIDPGLRALVLRCAGEIP